MVCFDPVSPHQLNTMITRKNNTEYLRHLPNVKRVNVNVCSLCQAEILGGGRMGVHAHLRKHIKSGEITNEDRLVLVENIVNSGKVVTPETKPDGVDAN